MRANRSIRCGSSSLATSFARFHTQPISWSQRRTVSADTSIPCLAWSVAARVAQLHRVRHQPYARGAALSKAPRERVSHGQRLRADRLDQHGYQGSPCDTLVRSDTHWSVSTRGRPQYRSDFGPQHRAIRYETPEDTHTVRAGVWHASGLALLEASPVRLLMAQ